MDALYGDLRSRKEELERQIDAASGAGEYGRANQLLEEQRQVEDQLKASGADVDPAKAVALEHQVRCRRRWTRMTTIFGGRGAGRG